MTPSETFEQALQAVAAASHEPKFKIGQTVYPKHGADRQRYIVIGMHRPMFGGWHYDVVAEIDPTGPLYVAAEALLSDKPPVGLHPGHTGKIYFTRNGAVALKSIEGGFPELRNRHG